MEAIATLEHAVILASRFRNWDLRKVNRDGRVHYSANIREGGHWYRASAKTPLAALTAAIAKVSAGRDAAKSKSALPMLASAHGLRIVGFDEQIEQRATGLVPPDWLKQRASGAGTGGT